MLIHDVPRSQGVTNLLKRAKQMVNVTYTPVKPMPTVHKVYPEGIQKGKYVESLTPAWLPVKGMVYSSVRLAENYVGFNVSLETFVSALANPNSVLYTRAFEGTGQNVHCYYGIVCSCFASYVHDLPYRIPCVRWPEQPFIVEVDSSALENLQLGDIVLEVKQHIAVITGIERDETGMVRYISVSESVLPFCRELRFSAEAFVGYWLNKGYKIYRNMLIDNVTYTPNPFSPVEGDESADAYINPVLLPNLGEKANYAAIEGQVEISVFDGDYTELCVSEPDGAVERFPIDGESVTVPLGKPGYYSAYCAAGEKKSEAVHWYSADLRIRSEKEQYEEGEPVTIAVDNPTGDEIVAWQFNRTENNRGCGGMWFQEAPKGETITLPAPYAKGILRLRIMARSKYGVYKSNEITISVGDR
ncbi:MAG: hypothetical protein MJ099_03535 [Clostridia bacterium]|nr:hypothetical protein [Clostridia bacterium]